MSLQHSSHKSAPCSTRLSPKLVSTLALLQPPWLYFYRIVHSSYSHHTYPYPSKKKSKLISLPASTRNTKLIAPVSRNIVRNYAPHLKATTGEELEATLQWGAQQMLGKYLRKFRNRRQFISHTKIGEMYSDPVVNRVRCVLWACAEVLDECLLVGG